MELMITLVLAALILGLAAPSFREFRMNARMTGASNDLLLALQQARSEAIKRQRIVGFCVSGDAGAATPACDGEFGGWVVWVDDDGTPAMVAGDGNGSIEANEQIITRYDSLDAALRLSGDGTFVSYTPNGFTREQVGGAPGARVLMACDERNDDLLGSDFRKRVISVSRTGRPAIVKSVSAVGALEAEGLAFDFQCAQGGGS
jgi:type IV fimbrial biogenesis protein FimT